MFAEVILSRRFPKYLGVFDYEVPASLKNRVALGQLVHIPFRLRTVEGVIVALKQTPFAGKRIRPLAAILDDLPVLTEGQIALARWMAKYYLVSIGTVVKMMLPEIPKRLEQKELNHRNIPISPASKPHDEKISAVRFNDREEMYAHLRHELQQSQSGQTLILTPEISYIARLMDCVPPSMRGNAVLFHSKLKPSEAYQALESVRSGRARCVIGTKLAVMLPFVDIRSVLVDREEDDEHKNYDQNPRFDARTVAEFLARRATAKLTYYSPSPRIDLMARIASGDVQDKLIGSPLLNAPMVVDMDEERRKRNFSLISDTLSDEIRSALSRKQKVFLFLNRRGSAAAVYCKDCGKRQSCTSCGRSLSAHTIPRHARLQCHACQTVQEFITCPQCGSVRFRFSLPGTQKLERELQSAFPSTPLLRIDSDQPKFAIASLTVGTEFALRRISLSEFHLIAVISADTTFESSDYRAGERTFHLLATLLCDMRRDSKVVIQTTHSSHPVFAAIAQQNPDSWYRAEISERNELGYPPASTLVKLMKDFNDVKSCLAETERLVRSFLSSVKAFALPPSRSRRKSKVRGTVVVKRAGQGEEVDFTDLFEVVPNDWIIDRDPVSLV